jgi:hypothetical protein
MRGVRHAYVHEAELVLDEGLDPAAVGAAVTIALCGSCDHEPPCHWPNNHDIDARPVPAVFRTLFVADPGDEPEVRERIERALVEADEWEVRSVGARPVRADEQELAARLLQTPLRA